MNTHAHSITPAAIATRGANTPVPSAAGHAHPRAPFETASVRRAEHRLGFRPFVVKQIVRESDTIKSFYLVPDDGEPLAPFRPGQHVTVRLEVSGQREPLLRSYTLSNRPHGMHYRITIKHEAGADGTPPGLASSYFHRAVGCGTCLWVSSPRGSFHIDPHECGPVALISAGVGLTPMVSMLSAIVAHGGGEPVWFVHGARNGREHAMGALVRRLARGRDNIQVHVSYSQPNDLDRPGRDYDEAGRVDGALLRRLLPHLACELFLCGPGQFIDGLREDLIQHGVDPQRIRSERFGTPSADEPSWTAVGRTVATPTEKPVEVRFARSGVVARWLPGTASLLEMAEAQGLIII